MAQTIAAQLDKTLNDFERNVPHVQATAVVSTEGAAILSISTRSGRELERGEMVRVLIEGTEGYILIRSVGEYAILVALVEKEVRLGLLFYEAKKCIQLLREIL